MFSGPERVAAGAIGALSAAILLSYLLDVAGLPLVPWALSALAAAGGVAIAAALTPDVDRRRSAAAAFAAIVAATLGWTAALGWPHFLPPGDGADLIHHLLLVDYIERNWHLVHDPALQGHLGEMAQYTPGLHLLAAIGGRVSGTTGLQAIYPIIAVSVALKCGLVFLIARRILPRHSPRLPLAVAAVALVFLPAYLADSFAENSFLAQVLSELFAVAAWWAIVVWDEEPLTAPLLLFALFGCAVFLTWPVWIGPLLATFTVVVFMRRDVDWRTRARHFAIAVAPIAAIAALYSISRLGWAQIVRSGGVIVMPGVLRYGWLFVALFIAGVPFAAAMRRARTAALLLAAIAAQAAVLYWLAVSGGAPQPYMAIKMAYLALYPQAVTGALALYAVWKGGLRLTRPTRRVRVAAAWMLAAAVCLAAVGAASFEPVRPPVVSRDLDAAGRWARDHVPPHCVEYLVPNGWTAYWLHLAVLGNPRTSARTADDETFSFRAALLRWLSTDSLTYAVADTSALTRDVRSDLDVLAQFGTAAVARRRGAARCPAL